jgi:hypothetical protein
MGTPRATGVPGARVAQDGFSRRERVFLQPGFVAASVACRQKWAETEIRARYPKSLR